MKTLDGISVITSGNTAPSLSWELLEDNSSKLSRIINLLLLPRLLVSDVKWLDLHQFRMFSFV